MYDIQRQHPYIYLSVIFNVRIIKKVLADANVYATALLATSNVRSRVCLTSDDPVVAMASYLHYHPCRPPVMLCLRMQVTRKKNLEKTMAV